MMAGEPTHATSKGKMAPASSFASIFAPQLKSKVPTLLHLQPFQPTTDEYNTSSNTNDFIANITSIETEETINANKYLKLSVESDRTQIKKHLL